MVLMQGPNHPTQPRSWSAYYSEETTHLTMAGSVTYHWPYIFEVFMNAKRGAMEVGCGRGIHSIFLSHFFPNVIGIDSEIRLVERARGTNAKLRGRARFLVCDAFRLKFLANTFGVCFSQGFLEHYADGEIMLLTEEQLRVANVIVASVPSFFYKGENRGDERLMAIEDWSRIFRDFDARLFYYGPKLPRPGLFGPFRNVAAIANVILNKRYTSHVCMIIKRKMAGSTNWPAKLAS